MLDASRAVGVVEQPDESGTEKQICAHAGGPSTKNCAPATADQIAKPLLTIEEARAASHADRLEAGGHRHARLHRVALVTTETAASRGCACASHQLDDLVAYIDWSPFFHTWELRGRYPAILENTEARKLFEDAQQLLGRILSEKLLTARGIYGFFPANSTGDDVELYTDDSRAPGADHVPFPAATTGESRRSNSITAWPITSRPRDKAP